ncbi:hypothetical protein Goari_004261 [Gossypium aridum]|uniref:Uncharacterized protein n=1 Tax=Gossypium aridum TaxID=34290 RepID=A0A7J8Y3D7_GOSAI|nr:hypothetical protein [Gossypium aridum]
MDVVHRHRCHILHLAGNVRQSTDVGRQGVVGSVYEFGVTIVQVKATNFTTTHEEHIKAWDRRAILTRSQTIFRSGHGGGDAIARRVRHPLRQKMCRLSLRNIQARMMQQSTTEKDDYTVDPEETIVQWVVLDTYLGDDNDDEKSTSLLLRIHSC